MSLNYFEVIVLSPNEALLIIGTSFQTLLSFRQFRLLWYFPSFAALIQVVTALRPTPSFGVNSE